ncbi:MAG: UvrB/UvrC motif-containing protein [Clostridiales bacterium]|nr:UvrB/UvrC motif-containing protein [Clostridiales bacterium]
MICQKCKSAVAAVCISQTVNGQKVDIYLCQKCANESAVAGLKAAFGLSGIYPGHFVFGGDGDKPFKAKSSESCPVCGKTFAEIQKDGKIGCANCYAVFRNRLKPFIERVHRSLSHKGRCPSSVSEAYKTARMIGELKLSLEEAVKNEEYERAAGIRDHIRGLEVNGE